MKEKMMGSGLKPEVSSFLCRRKSIHLQAKKLWSLLLQKIKNFLCIIAPNKWALVSSILIFILLFNYLFSVELKITPNIKLKQKLNQSTTSTKPNQVVWQNVIASEIRIPIRWGDLGRKLIESGVIDKTKFDEVMGTLSDSDKKLMEESNNGEIVMTQQNSRLILNLLWGFGLANKNDVLDKGEMMQDPKQTGNMASTGGWGISTGDSMSHYSKHNFVNLTPEQQSMVEEMSKSIYRPCCDNSTHFPDCNHGMAMLGLLELMSANGVSKEEAYKVALEVNSMWFPQQYQELSVYFAESGITWDKVDPKTVLGISYSSASGYRNTKAQIKSLPQTQKGGGGCGL